MRGSGPLYDELHTLLEAEAMPTAVHRLFASLPPLLRERGVPHQLLVTTSFDLALEQAFLERGEEFDVVFYIASGRDRGRFCHIPPDGSAQVITIPNTYTDELSLERRTIILKLHGRVDQSDDRELESFVVTEDDYIDYLAQSDVSGALPVGLTAKLRRSHFLFLGYAMTDWNLRVVLNRLWGDHALSYRSWAVQPEAAAARARVLAPARGRRARVAARGLRGGARPRGRRRGGQGVNTPGSPYKGLAAFGDSALDAMLFFGRERERDLVIANMTASRLTLLYGPSGVGKSSLLNAGVARALRDDPETGRVAIFNSWIDDRTDELRAAVAESADGYVYVILDQFEEFFLYHDVDGAFGTELASLLGDRGLRVNVLLSLREDTLAVLDAFKGRIANLYGNSLRLDHLDRESARAAVVGPLRRLRAGHRRARGGRARARRGGAGRSRDRAARAGRRRTRPGGRRSAGRAHRGALPPARARASVGRGAGGGLGRAPAGDAVGARRCGGDRP